MTAQFMTSGYKATESELYNSKIISLWYNSTSGNLALREFCTTSCFRPIFNARDAVS